MAFEVPVEEGRLLKKDARGRNLLGLLYDVTHKMSVEYDEKLPSLLNNRSSSRSTWLLLLLFCMLFLYDFVIHSTP